MARYPTDRRDGSRLMVIPITGPDEALVHGQFVDLPDLLREGDLLVANDTRVMPSRVFARRPSGGRVQLLVLEPGPGTVRALARPLRRIKDGEVLALEGGGTAVIRHVTEEAPGTVLVDFDRAPAEVMALQGQMPLPPYLRRDAEPDDVARYQTVYAKELGAAVAPTAGLHFTSEVFSNLAARGVGFCTVTLHVGIGTFRPVTEEDVARGRLHEEPYMVPQSTVEAIARTRERGGRVIAVGTTSARTLEAATKTDSRVPMAGSGVTDLFIHPPYATRCVDGLLTNFHLPGSSLIMLVGALCGQKRILAAYARAVEREYRFYSYGDAMLLI